MTLKSCDDSYSVNSGTVIPILDFEICIVWEMEKSSDDKHSNSEFDPCSHEYAVIPYSELDLAD